MGTVSTEDFTLVSAVQTSFGVLGGSPVWKRHEPNEIPAFGNNDTLTARNPISPDRQRRKGVITDRDSPLEIGVDLTFDSALDFLPDFFYVVPTNIRVQSGALFDNLAADDDPPPAGTDSGYTHDALSAAMTTNQLIYARGFDGSGNNGLKLVITGSTTTATLISTVLTDEAPGNDDNASIETAGFRFTDLTWTDATSTLASATVDETTIGLTPGQLIYIGGLTGSERFSTGTAWARVVTVTASGIVVDRIKNHLGADFAGGGDVGSSAVDLLFGPFIRNVSNNDAAFIERYRQFEGGFPNAYETDPPTPVANPDEYDYAPDCKANVVTLAMPGQGFVTLGVTYEGTAVEAPVNDASRKTNAASAAEPSDANEGFSTSSDFARIGVFDVDETGISTDITDMTVTIGNSVSTQKVHGTLGPRFLTKGQFLIDAEITAIFTDPNVITRIRNNTTVWMGWILTNGTEAIGFDVPSAVLGNGGREFPRDELVTISLTGQAFKDPTLGTSLSASLFPIYPTS